MSTSGPILAERGVTAGWRPSPPGSAPATTAAWVIIVAVGAIPLIVDAEVFGRVSPLLPLLQILFALGALGVCLLVPRLRPVWRFCAAMVALLVVLDAMARTDAATRLQTALGIGGFEGRMLSEQVVKLGAALAMIVVLLALGYRRPEFFLRAGDRGARIRPAPLLGFPRSDSWRRFGLIWGTGVAVVLGAIQFAVLRPTAADLAALWTALPAVLLFAASNAFAEEMTYRAPMLATLEPAVGSGQALWGSAVFFGVAHYFGIPGGLVGAAASVFMGWLLSKAMLETRGLFWPWFIHFLSDVAIFSSVAIALG